MPELPEVETTLQGIAPFLDGKILQCLEVRNRRLRWPVPRGLEAKVGGQKVRSLSRRGKYILIELERGGLLIHLGMSGSIRVVNKNDSPEKHDHFDLYVKSGQVIRYRDPRRFGCLLWHPQDIHQHIRLKNLGVEPLSPEFTGEILHSASKKRKVPVKSLIMDGSIVVGAGNIYASESLFDSAIHPHRRCDRISAARYDDLAESIKKILARAIAKGGTTLKDFVGVDGAPGYFEQKLMVYGREGEPCLVCGGEIRRVVTAQRATYYCASCQT